MIKNIIDENGQPWNVKITTDRVRFYDGRKPNDDYPLGKFVSEYFIKTILTGNSGLDLYHSEPSWSISNTGMTEIRSWLREQI